MKTGARWISMMMAAVLAAGTLQVPAFAGADRRPGVSAVTEETAAEGAGRTTGAFAGPAAEGSGRTAAPLAGAAAERLSKPTALSAAAEETVATEPAGMEAAGEYGADEEPDGAVPSGVDGAAEGSTDGADPAQQGETGALQEDAGSPEEDAASDGISEEFPEEGTGPEEDPGPGEDVDPGEDAADAGEAESSEDTGETDLPEETGEWTGDPAEETADEAADEADGSAAGAAGEEDGYEMPAEDGNDPGAEQEDPQVPGTGDGQAMPELTEDPLPGETVTDPALDAAVSGLYVAAPSQAQIRSFFAQHPAPWLYNTYAEEPSARSPYSAGRLSDESQQYGLNALNQARYIAGLSADVTADESYISMAQAAALLNAANKKLSHYPERPSGIGDSLYELGSEGASSSNIAYGSGSVAWSVHLWMSDSDSSNIDRVGHRRWILNPSMGRTGFGAVGAYSAVYAHDRSRTGTASVKRVAWPAQNMPLEFFDDGDAWSVSFGEEVDSAAVSVLLRRQSDGKEWNFSGSGSDGYFAVDNGWYGQTGCVIFRPDGVSYSSGDRFDVTITGACADTVQYTVDFFSICEGDHDYDVQTVADPSCTKSGEIWKICRKCGDVEYEYPPALGHSYQVTGSSGGLVTLRCDTCGDEVTGAAPSSFYAFWKDLADTESSSYSTGIPSGLEAGAEVGLWMPDSYISHAVSADRYFDRFDVQVQEAEGCQVQRNDDTDFTLRFSRAGTYHIVVTAAYDPSVSRTYTIRIVKEVESLTLTADPASPQPYERVIRLAAAADGGKGTLRYSFIVTGGDGTQTVLSSGSTSSQYRWTPAGAGDWKLRAEVTDEGDGDRVVASNILSYTVEKGGVAVKDGKAVTAAGPLTYGQKNSEIKVNNAVFTSAESGKELKGTFAFDKPDTVLSAGTRKAAWTFTPSDKNYEPLKGTLTVTVNKAVPVITKAPQGKTSVYHPAKNLDSIALSGGEADVAGTWRWTAGGTVPEVPGGSYACEFVPSDTANYESVQTSAKLVIKKAVPWLKKAEGSAVTYGQSLADSDLTGTVQYADKDATAVAGTFRWADSSVRPAVRDSLKTEYEVIFTPADTKNYEEITGKVKISVEKADRPAQMPPETISVPYSTGAISDQILRDRGITGWSFTESDLGRSLEPGSPAAAAVRYTAADAGNYKVETTAVTVTRSTCEHKGGTRTEGALEATCKKAGYTGDVYCKICGELLQSGSVIPQKAHTWDQGTVQKEPTLEEDGSRVYTCTVCKETRTEAIAKLLDIRDASAADLGDMIFTGAALRPQPALKYGETALVRDTDYRLAWKNNVNAGTATVTVTGTGLYGGSRDLPFTILPRSIAGSTVTGITARTYDGSPQTQTFTVKSGNTLLKEGTDYSVEYSDNTQIGTATVTITGENNYTGTITRSFAIQAPAPVPVTGLKLNKYEAELACTKTLQLTAEPLPENATDRAVTWTSSNSAIATVDENGLVKAKKYGTVTITARSANGITEDCEIRTLFADVANAGKSYYQPVYWAVDSRITVVSTYFRPDDYVTRGEFVAFLWRLAGKPASSAKVSFQDVNSQTKFYDAIRWAVGMGIIKGYSDGTFKSDNEVTRGETATMIWRYAGKPAPKSTKSPFSDLPASGLDSYKAILWGAENGIIKGSGGKFLKSDGCTRGQVVTFLYRYDRKFR